MQVYNFPRYYELAFSFRDIPAEVDFIAEAIRRHSRIPVRTILELASGNSPHLEELCSRGYTYLGLEINDAMIAYTTEKILLRRLDAALCQGNMVDFDLPRLADCALVLLCSFYIRNDDEFDRHMKSVARHVRSGGLYILDGVVSYSAEDMGSTTWEESRNGSTVKVAYTTGWADEPERLMTGCLALDFEEAGERQHVEHTEIRKVYGSQDFRERVELTGLWQYVAGCGDFDIDVEPEEAGRSIAVLRRI